MEKNYYSIDKCKTFLLLLYVIYMLYCGSLNYNNSIMYQERLPFYKELEESRGSRLVVYITGDRMGMETQMGIDAFGCLNLMARGSMVSVPAFSSSTTRWAWKPP